MFAMSGFKLMHDVNGMHKVSNASLPFFRFCRQVHQMLVNFTQCFIAEDGKATVLSLISVLQK
jgi:hypothetical protein